MLTTDAGRAHLANRLPATARVCSWGGALTGRRLRDAVRAEGHRRILTEGGPTLIGALVRDRVLDELFLTLSPVLAGREGDPSGRLSLVQGLRCRGRSSRGACWAASGATASTCFCVTYSPAPELPVMARKGAQGAVHETRSVRRGEREIVG